jgi:hypothetical protein
MIVTSIANKIGEQKVTSRFIETTNCIVTLTSIEVNHRP